MWTFREYVSGRLKELSDWFNGLPDKKQAEVFTMMEFLEASSRADWKRPRFDLLSDMDRMGEIRVGKINGVQTRLIGFFGPNRHEFTVVLVVTKKGRNYTPKGWEATAKKRRQECLSDRRKCRAWDP